MSENWIVSSVNMSSVASKKIVVNAELEFTVTPAKFGTPIVVKG